jgi:hypothetical protein
MGIRWEKMKAEWEIVRVKAVEENVQAYHEDHWWRLTHHALDFFTESFRHGPYLVVHSLFPLWVVVPGSALLTYLAACGYLLWKRYGPSAMG